MALPFVGQGTAAKLAERRRQLDSQEKSLATSRTILATVEADRDEIAAREHRGEISAEKSSEEFAAIEERERVHLSEVDRLTRMCQLLEDEIEQLERVEKVVEFEAAGDRARNARAAAVAVSAIFAKHISGAVATAPKLERARASADHFAAQAAALHPDGPDAYEAALLDEPDWADVAELEQLLQLMEAGPLQPATTGAASAMRAAKAQASSDNAMIRAAIDGLAGLAGLADPRTELERILPERLHERAWARAQQVNADRRRISEERVARERAQAPQRVAR
jgi:hypothetical protein